MLRLMPCFIFLLWLLSIESLKTSLLKTSYFTRFKTRLYNLGSDALERPKDEDSPEYREYLKQLLKMQANRATGGFAAPSSGSSDAYFAKLTRIKIEKNARYQAGLDGNVDTGYIDADYANAKYESAEPMVRAAPIAGGSGGGGVRPPSPEEVLGMELAQQKVAEELAKKNGEPIPEIKPSQLTNTLTGNTVTPSPVNMDNPYAEDYLKKFQGASDMNEGILDMIDSIANKANIDDKIDNMPGVNPSSMMNRPATSSNNNKSSGIKGREAIKEAMKKAIEEKNKEKGILAEQSNNSESKVDEPIVMNDKTKKVENEPLNEKDMEIAAKALHDLVKHRGGGPFGRGRISEASAVIEFEENLLQALNMIISQDSGKSIQTIQATAPSAPSTPAPSTPAPVPAPVPVPVVQEEVIAKSKPEPVAAAVNNAPPVSSPAPAQPVPVASQVAQTSPNTSGESSKTIAGGLDDFLRAPEELSLEQLNGLQAGIIQCLSMISQEIQQRPLNSSLYSAPQPKISQPSVPTQPVNIEEELRMTLGLLLKHRGGPGFGHGRLEGSELEALGDRLRSVTSKLREEATV